MGIQPLKIFAFKYNLLNRLSTDKGNWLMMEEGGLIVCFCMEFISLFVLLNGR